jgi:IclR family KDG regulon transcriptional repressor
LQLVGFVEKSQPESHYKLGLGLVKFAYTSLQQMNINTIATPFLEQIYNQTNETIHLAVLNNFDLIYVIKLESTQSVRTGSTIGKSAPLYCTGIGKAMLSVMSPENLEKYFSEVKFHQFTNTTIIDEQHLRHELKIIQTQGYSIDNGEHEEDVRCIAVPLVVRSRLFGAFSITAPKYRMDDSTIQRYLPLICEAQKNITERLQLSVLT